MGSATKTINDANFETEVIKSSIPVLVDFWAEWCGPCKQLIPVLEEIAAELQDKVVIAKLNVDESTQTPGKYGIRSIPALLLFKNGELVSTKVGAMPKSSLLAWLKESV